MTSDFTVDLDNQEQFNQKKHKTCNYQFNNQAVL